MKNKILLGLITMMLAACSTTTPKEAQTTAPVKLPQTIEEAVNSDLRTATNKERDKSRHPKETLEFFGLKPDMTVVEIWPSRGWYTEILAPLVTTQGKYIIADPPQDPRGYTTPRKEWMKKYPEIEAKSQITFFHPETHLEIAPENTADLVLTFRSLHSWQTEKNKEDAFKAFFKVLKPGGVLGVVEHRAPEKKKFDPKSGYVRESEVIRIAQKAGFKLVEKSEINANPKDTKNYKEGVWTLPPTLRLGDQDRAKYTEIGESDRMTLKFTKPTLK